jgi:dolichol-phosphate mannosyltransferase
MSVDSRRCCLSGVPVVVPLPTVSIIIPTYREAQNLPLLIPQIEHAMRSRHWTWEAIVVDDDSTDGTPEVLAQLARGFPQLRYKIRKTQRGLSSAVVAGISMARNNYIVVMDADLSHPPDTIPALVDKLLDDEADFVIGSRYVAGGATSDWTAFRQLNSSIATWLSRPFSGAIKDPMAGFFALRRSSLESADTLNPIGYKIGLELLAKCRITRVAEVPITFHNRVHGTSKMTAKVQFRYLEHLSRLYDYRFPKGSPRVKFLIAAAAGAMACLATVAGLDALHFMFALSLAAGLLAMIAVTFAFFLRYIRTQRDFVLMKHPYSEFLYISLAEFLFGYFTAATLPSSHNLLRVGAGIVALLAVRYTLRKLFLHDIRGLRGRHKEPVPIRFAYPAEGRTASIASA